MNSLSPEIFSSLKMDHRMIMQLKMELRNTKEIIYKIFY